MGRKKLSGKRYSDLCESYFLQCGREGRHPSLPGLALALGMDSRAAVRRAITRVEEFNVQSAFQKDTAQSAKFILQCGFGYGEKRGKKDREDIKVEIEE